MTPDTVQSNDEKPDPITIGEATVEDVFVDFNLKSMSPGQLKVVIDAERLENEWFMPVDCDPDDRIWIAEQDGVYVGFNDGPVQPPADTSAYTNTTEVEHESGITEDRVPHLNHVIKNRVNEDGPLSVSVTYHGEYPNTKTTSVELAQELIDRYINGPLGTDCVSYWADYHGKGYSGYDDDYEGYIDCDVALVPVDIYTWGVTRVDDLDVDESSFGRSSHSGSESEIHDQDSDPSYAVNGLEAHE